MAWRRVKTGFTIIVVFAVSIITNLALTGIITMEFVALSISIAALFWLMISLEEKHDEIMRVLKKIEENTRPLTDGGSVESENEEEVKTSGAGAFLGMLLGATAGLLLGSGIAVLAGGIIGGLLGDQVEYEIEKEKKLKYFKKVKD